MNSKTDGIFYEELKVIRDVRDRAIKFFLFMVVIWVMTIMGLDHLQLSVYKRMFFLALALWVNGFVSYSIFYRVKKIDSPICPNCQKDFFKKKEVGKFFTSRRPNFFTNKCLNCGLELNPKKEKDA